MEHRPGSFNSYGGRGHKPFKAKGPVQQNKNLPKMAAASKFKAAKQRTATSQLMNEISYDDIDPQFLICHICKKKFKTGSSFQLHLNEDSHFKQLHIYLQMYSSSVNKMREAYEVRYKKTAQPKNRNFYCDLCGKHDSNETTHCKTIEHRKLKKFILPSCLVCNIKEMPSKRVFEEHRLTPEHMWMVQKRVQKTTQTKENMNKVLVVTNKVREEIDIRSRQYKLKKSQEQARKLEESRIISQSKKTEMALWIPNEDNMHPKERRKFQKEKKMVTQDPDADVLVIYTQHQEQIQVRNDRNMYGTEGSRKHKPVGQRHNVLVTDYQEGDDLSSLTLDMFPPYNTNRSVGESFIEEVNCYICKLCKKLLDSEETAALHPKTWKHHAKFTKMLRFKSKCVRQRLRKKGKLDLPEQGSSQECAKTNQGKAKNGHGATAAIIKTETDAEMDEVWNQVGDLQAGNIKKEIDAEMDDFQNLSDNLEDWDPGDSDDGLKGDDLENFKQSDHSDDSQLDVDLDNSKPGHSSPDFKEDVDFDNLKLSNASAVFLQDEDYDNFKQSNDSEVFTQDVDLDNLKLSDGSEDWNQDEDLDDDADGWKPIDDFKDWA